MSSTRYAKPGSPFRQQRYASSAECESGLYANLTAKRCRGLESTEDRELIWFLQLLSHHPGGLKKVASDLREKFPDRIGTKAMRRIGPKDAVYNSNQVKVVRGEFPPSLRNLFLLKGEWDVYETEEDRLRWPVDENRQREHRRALLSFPGLDELISGPARTAGERGILEVDARPLQIAAKNFLTVCRAHAQTALEPDLIDLCLNPARDLDSFWYFHELRDCLREYHRSYVDVRKAATVVTEIGRQVYDTLDYAAQSRCLVLIDGLARTGKTFATKAWCDQRPGRARYVQAPSTNDDKAWFTAVAKGLGNPAGTNWKANELRERCEASLQNGDLILVIDEAHYCWPTLDYRYALPGRINWIMTALVNHGVAVALITTPQFIRTQKVVETRTNWTSEQFIGRIGHYQKLPDSLSETDLERVARVFVPEGDDRSIEALVKYAQGSAKYLAAIETCARRARYLALKDGRERVAFKDIKLAISQSVIPSDAALAEALAAPDKHSRRRLARPLQTTLTAPSTPAKSGFRDGEKQEPLVADLSRSGARLTASELAAA